MADRSHTWWVARNTVPDHMERGQEAVDLFLDMFAEELERRLAYNSPEDSGDLSRSWYTRRLGAIGGGKEPTIDYKVASDEIQAKITSTGSGKFNKEGSTGRIKPTTAKALVFFWKRIGAMTAWKGSVSDDFHAEEFIRWASARGMQPFLTWPRGQVPNPYALVSMAETMAAGSDLADRAFAQARAGE